MAGPVSHSAVSIMEKAEAEEWSSWATEWEI